ncbi:hypothetical protein [Novosphingobium sp. P6W]|uniref:hypothetical protein n=1 Tax=Novosphingobium sp. P6W TaxID=1609758 RepID=UPI0005C2DA1E|nr:hypothetical protein [Novosphingobium sp. P6W]AXB80072.1 hypothetical protein TQ38_026030 [Novosphingobium sp. P6W]KIS30255.1 hypothetical protein TQ38_23690 [Novosphingobium sp. P6W]
MDEVPIGPQENDDQLTQPAVDAQSETERDIERGLAGAEAKSFSEPGKAKISDTEARASESDEADPSSETQDSLISGRRNADRE